MLEGWGGKGESVGGRPPTVRGRRNHRCFLSPPVLNGVHRRGPPICSEWVRRERMVSERGGGGGMWFIRRVCAGVEVAARHPDHQCPGSQTLLKPCMGEDIPAVD
ncbi:hypothetical protein AAFF_G00009730 [Aldrovandia affinis]|uniref:Uncharacterized protein n=1 Tax=Aldrovandia affinis TaxID=143900 RepID=A0AAD7S731_9TELE|nr:hypothetical protein AAFF_G00009730 [Aldrovandia affinis]